METKTLRDLDDNDLGKYVEVWFHPKPNEEAIVAGTGVLLNYEQITRQPIGMYIPCTLFVLSGRVKPYDMVSSAKVQIFDRHDDGSIS